MTEEDDRAAVRRGYDELGEVYAEERGDTVPPALPRLADELDGGARVLDAGCGPGAPATAWLAERFDVVGLDVSREQLALARENAPAAALVCGDMTAPGFACDTFDAVVALNSVIHVPRERHADVFAEFHRVLRPGGYALLTVGESSWEGRNPDWLDAGVEMRWSFQGPEATAELLREAGFGIVDETRLADDLGGGAFVSLTARARDGYARSS